MLTTVPIQTRLIALSEVSRITSLGKTSIYELIAVGELRPIKLGRKTVFSESEVFEWVGLQLESRSKNSKGLPSNTARHVVPINSGEKAKISLQSASPSKGASHE